MTQFTPKLPLKISKCDYMHGLQMAVYAHDILHVSPAMYDLLAAPDATSADILHVLKNLPCMNLDAISQALDAEQVLVLHQPIYPPAPLHITVR